MPITDVVTHRYHDALLDAQTEAAVASKIVQARMAI